MSKFVKYTVLPLAVIYAFSWIVAIYFKLTLTPQRINARKVNPKVFEYALIFKGYDPFVAEFGRHMYENGDFTADENGIFA